MNKIFKKIILLWSSIVLSFSSGCKQKSNAKINFLVDGTVYFSANYDGKDSIKMPDNPTKDGYVFEGWYWDKDSWQNPFTVNSLSEIALSPTMDVYAHFIDDNCLEGTQINIKNAQKTNLDGVGDVFYLSVRSNQIVCKLYDYVEVNHNAKWSVSLDIGGRSLIESKTIQLAAGDSPLYYIFVTDNTGKSETYFLIIHRNNVYSIYFNSNGGTYCAPISIDEGDTLDNAPMPERNGYTFSGWDYDFSQKINGNVEANALWNANKYQIIYDPTEGSLESNTQEVTFGQQYSLYVPFRLGYTFKGWKQSDGTAFPDSGTWNLTNNIELIANWQITGYYITYVLNGGTFPITPKTAYNVNESFNIFNPTRTGYTFAGWCINPNLTNPVTDLRIEAGTTGDKTFYAKWASNEYLITYDVNGGDPLTESTQTVLFGQNFVLKVPNRTGYAFDGWFSGNVRITDQDVWNKTQDITLTAHWTLAIYQITYKLNGGSNNSSNPKTYTYYDSVTLLEPTRDGYLFEGWCANSDLSDPDLNVHFEAGTTGDRTYYAKWSKEVYTITYDVNGGDPLQNNTQTVAYWTNYSLITPTRNGYTFSGWLNGSSVLENTGMWSITSDVTLLAKWTIIKYQITYTLNGGSNNKSNPSTYTVEDNVILQEPMKAGYNFEGWFSDGQEISCIPTGSVGNLTLEARWNARLNVLSVLSNDTSKGTVEIISGEGYSNESITVNATPKENCIFKGWFLNGVKVSGDLTYTFTMPTSDCELYGVFRSTEEETAWKNSKGATPIINNENNTITYGLYPQKRVSDSSLIKMLECTTPESNGFYFCNDNFYVKANGISTILTQSFDDGASIKPGTQYWFLCEPIVWKILKNVGNEYLLISKTIIEKSAFSGDGGYSKSAARKYLNNEFYKKAFCLDNSYIKRDLVDNSSSTMPKTGAPYNDNDTFDNVFILSYNELSSSKYGFSSYSNRKCATTDFAKTRGASNGYYWTRSCTDGMGPYSVEPQGGLETADGRCGYIGLRPAIKIILN